MESFTNMSLLDVSQLNTEQALNYFWANVDEGYFKDREGFYADVLAALAPHIPSAYFTLGDFGCACGYFLKAVHDAYPTADLTGVDYAENGLTRARALRIGASWIHGDITAPIFKPAVFDLVTCIEVLEHIADYPAALREMMDVLKPGGVLVITVPNADTWKGHVNHWTPGDLTRMLTPYGRVSVQAFRNGANILAKVVKG